MPQILPGEQTVDTQLLSERLRPQQQLFVLKTSVLKLGSLPEGPAQEDVSTGRVVF